MLWMSNFCMLATDGGKGKGSEDGGKLLKSYPSAEIGKSGGRAVFYLRPAEVKILGLKFLNHRHIRMCHMFSLEMPWEPWTWHRRGESVSEEGV